MDVSTIFFTGIGLSLVISFLVVRYLRQPLYTILVELCQTEERASFWMTIINLCFILVPFMFSMLYKPEGVDALAFEISRQLGWAMFGLIGALLAISFVVGISIPRFEARQRRLEKENSK